MNCIINGVIEYDEEKLTLIGTGTESLQHLTVTTSRLLSLLLHHHGNVVSRDTIFEEVWDAFDKTPSDKNLNQNIFLLRKNFQNLGLDSEIITTIPRVGFIISNSVDVRKINHENSAIQEKDAVKNKKKHLYSYMILTTTIIASISAAILFTTGNKLAIPSHKNDDFIVFSRLKNCTFMARNNDESIDNLDLEAYLSNFKTKYYTQCKKGTRADIFIRNDEQYHPESYTRNAITICNFSSNGTYSYCMNEMQIFVNNPVRFKK